MADIRTELAKIKEPHPKALELEGVVLCGMDLVNPTLSDMMETYLFPYCTEQGKSKLAVVETYEYTSAEYVTMNIFTAKKYSEFLQMIVKEDFINQRDRYKTTNLEIIYSENPGINLEELPVVTNTKRGRTLFDTICKSDYNKFEATDLHVIRVDSRYIEKGRVTDITEYCVYVPDKYLITI